MHGDILMAKAFIENRENEPQVDNKNGDKTDNRAENLEWVSAKKFDAWKNNLIQRCEIVRGYIWKWIKKISEQKE